MNDDQLDDEVILVTSDTDTDDTDTDDTDTDDTDPNTEPVDENTSSHRVDFEITVPAYQSDALEVLLVIGDGRHKAVWVQDETWTVSVDLLSNSTFYPTVFFFDRNGRVLLAWSRGTSRQTNTGPTQTIKLPEFFGQFSYTYADTDRDGISNMDELVSGTNPEVSEGSIIASTSDVRFLSFSDMFMLSERYETLIPRERPYTLDVVDPHPVIISLDSEGNGSYQSSESEPDGDRSLTEQTGTRTVSDLGVTWEGLYSRRNPERQEVLDFRSQTTRYSDITYGQVGEQSGDIGGNNPSRVGFSYSVVGNRYDDDRCAVHYGQITLSGSSGWQGPQTPEMESRLGSHQRYTLSGTASPESSELGWRFTRELLGVILENYRVLNVDETFYCDFGDLPVASD